VVEFADSRSESVLESCARVRFDELGLEPPDLQVAIRDANGTRIARADFCWPGRHVVAEADGMLKYKEDSDLTRKYQRDERLLEAGWEVVHFTWAQLFSDAGQVVGRIRAAFGRAAMLRRR
jgi:very-short-patch-repair endonuclease